MSCAISIKSSTTDEVLLLVTDRHLHPVNIQRHLVLVHQEIEHHRVEDINNPRGPDEHYPNYRGGMIRVSSTFSASYLLLREVYLIVLMRNGTNIMRADPVLMKCKELIMDGDGSISKRYLELAESFMHILDGSDLSQLRQPFTNNTTDMPTIDEMKEREKLLPREIPENDLFYLEYLERTFRDRVTQELPQPQGRIDLTRFVLPAVDPKGTDFDRTFFVEEYDEVSKVKAERIRRTQTKGALRKIKKSDLSILMEPKGGSASPKLQV